jgi:hypothetical protein
LLEASAAYRACAVGTCPAVIGSFCHEGIQQLEKITPSIVVAVRGPDGSDVSGIRVFVDGREVPDAATGRALPVDPGAHVVRVMTADRTSEIRIVAREGEQNRLVELALPTENENDSGLAPEVWATGALGLAGLTVFAVAGAIALARYDELETRCGASQTCSPEDAEPVNTAAIVADVGLGVGLAGMGVAGVLAIVQPSTRGTTAFFRMTFAF